MLLSRHLDKDSLVGVLLERSEYAYYAEQGILKAHAAFLPFITSYPDDRISFCMEDGDVPVLLTSRKVLTEHDGLSDKEFEIICMEDIPGICSTYDESLTAMAAFSFDVSIVEQFVPLCNGNTVCMATDEEIHNPLLLAKAITDI